MPINEHEFKAQIEYARKLANINKTELAKILNMPRSTFQRKMEHPLNLTIAELFLMTDALANDALPEYIQASMGIKAIKRITARKGSVKDN